MPPPSGLTTQNWSAVLHNGHLWRAYGATIVVSFASGGTAVIVAGIVLMPTAINIYGTVQPLIVAFVVNSLPVGVRVMFGNIAQIGPQLEEAARVSGATSARCGARHRRPDARLGALGAWVIIAYGVSDNLTLPALLSAPGTELLSVQLLEIHSYGHTAQAAVLAIIILLTMAALMIVLGTINRARRAPTVLSD